MNYLLSVIVPTKNRYVYLKSIIEAFNTMDTGEVQLVIQDNSDDNKEILDYLGNDYSKNIKYCYLDKHIPISDNFTNGILNSNGKYVCMLGDDDAISSKLVDVVKYMDIKGVESAIFNKGTYYWPGMKFRVHAMPSLSIRKYTGRVIEIDPSLELMKCLGKGTTSLMKLPQIYHGVVKRQVLDKVYVECKTYFPGASPDMAIAIALSLVVKSHIYVDAPYTISGQAFHSAGGRGARNEHSGKLKDIRWLPNDIEENWEKEIPKIWTGATIYAESAHKALKSMGRQDLINSYNYNYLYAWFRSFNTEHKSLLGEIKNVYKMNMVKIYFYSNLIFLRRCYNFIKNILKTKLHITNDKISYNVDSSFEASKIVTNDITTRNISFK